MSPFQDQSKPYDSKKNCWIPDAEEGYVAGEITATKGDMVTAISARGNEVRPFPYIFLSVASTFNNSIVSKPALFDQAS